MTSLLIYFFSCWLHLINIASHHSHYTVTNVDYTGKNQPITISIKVNTEDLTLVLSHNYDISINLINDTNKTTIDSLISNYISATLKFKLNNKQKLPIQFQRKEIINEDAWIYASVSPEKKMNELEIMNSLFFETIMENTNLIIFSKNGKEQGFKTTFYERVVTFKFKDNR